MSKERIKEILIDIYGLTVFTTALLMTAIALLIAVMSIVFLLQGEVVRPIVCLVASGVLIVYSVQLMRQIK